MGNGDDFAADFVRLEDVEDFADAGPEQFGLGKVLQNLFALAHFVHRVTAGIGNASRETGNDGGDSRIERLRHAFDLFGEHERGDFELYALGGQLLDERQRRFCSGFGDRDLGVNVFGPAADFEGLALHFVVVVRKDFEGNRFLSDVLLNVFRESLKIRDAGFAHEGRIGGHAFDEGVGVEVQHALFVRAVGEELHS